MTVASHIPKAINEREFTLSWPGYAGKTSSEKRKLIKKKLDDYNIAITHSPANAPILNTFAPTTQRALAPMHLGGTHLVRAYFDNTSNTGRIKQGKPVVFDTVTGRAVTGVHDSWTADEYKTVGIAIEDFPRVGNSTQLVPVRLVPPAVSESKQEIYIGRCVKYGTEFTHTSLRDWLISSNQRKTWYIELRKEVGQYSAMAQNDAYDIPAYVHANNRDNVVLAYNVARQWIRPWKSVIVSKIDGFYYFSHYMSPSITGVISTAWTSSFNYKEIDVFDYSDASEQVGVIHDVSGHVSGARNTPYTVSTSIQKDSVLTGVLTEIKQMSDVQSRFIYTLVASTTCPATGTITYP